MAILAIDPGPVESGYVVVRGTDEEGGLDIVAISGNVSNSDMLQLIRSYCDCTFAIEDYTSRGVISSHGIETIKWIGRFQQRILDWHGTLVMIKRHDVLSFCPKLTNPKTGKKYSSDALVRRAMSGNFANTEIVKSHAWQALGVAYALRQGKGTICTK